jgi:hypothetical protein
MPTLRFLNPALHSQFVEGLRKHGFADTLSTDGAMRCSEKLWPQVNGIAPRIRDSCFPWYFSWFQNEDSAREFEQYLRGQNFRFELEVHDDRLVFLLPKDDEGKYDFGGADPPTRQHCSFCGKACTDADRFFASESAAICGGCVSYLHSEISGPSPSERDA